MKETWILLGMAVLMLAFCGYVVFAASQCVEKGGVNVIGLFKLECVKGIENAVEPK